MNASAQHQSAVEPPSVPEDADPRIGAWARARHALPDGPFERCIGPLLRATGWRGDAPQILEAMPHFGSLENANHLRLALHHLGLRSTLATARAEEISEDLLPAVLMAASGPLVLLERKGFLFQVYDPERDIEREIWLEGELRLCSVALPLASEEAQSKGARWFRNALFNLSREIGGLFALSFVINILVLAIPLFTMGVYNLALPAETVTGLTLAAGAALSVIALEVKLRRERARAIAALTARVSHSIATTGFGRVLTLPYAMVDRASVSRQIGWLRQFDTIMSAYSGPVAAALLDLPFAILLLFAIGFIAGPLVLPPLIAITLVIIAAVLLAPATERAAREAANAKSAHDILLREMLGAIECIRGTNAEALWRMRLIASHRRATTAQLRAARLEALIQNISTAMMALCGVAVIATGALLAMDGALTIGALVAATMLSGRIFAPLQIVLLRAQAIGASRDAAKRFESLLDIDLGRDALAAPPVKRHFKGELSTRELSFRFPEAEGFALRGVDLSLAPGEVLGLVGPSGAGKTTFLKLAAGLYKPTSGSVLIDGVNLNQFHRSELRSAVAYAPPSPKFFYGTLAQNLRIAAPTASPEDIETVLAECRISLEGAPFDRGVETRMDADAFNTLPITIRARINLARALLSDASVTLLESPSGSYFGLDEDAFRDIIAKRAGRRTFVIAAPRPEILTACDRVMVLKEGRLLGVKPASEALRTLQDEKDDP